MQGRTQVQVEWQAGGGVCSLSRAADTFRARAQDSRDLSLLGTGSFSPNSFYRVEPSMMPKTVLLSPSVPWWPTSPQDSRLLLLPLPTPHVSRRRGSIHSHSSWRLAGSQFLCRTNLSDHLTTRRNSWAELTEQRGGGPQHAWSPSRLHGGTHVLC